MRGSGDVHVVIAKAARVPCDARENVMLFDGTLHTGTTRVLTTTYPSLCERQTWGALTDGRWSTDWLWKIEPGASRLNIDVSSEHP